MSRPPSSRFPRARTTNRGLRTPVRGTTMALRRIGVDQGLLNVAYQPVVDLHSERVYAYEVLARPSRDVFPNPPAMFLAATGLEVVGELGREIRRLAVEGCQHRLFVNIHPDELRDRWIVRPDDPIFFHDRGVCLEVTESVPLTHWELVSGILGELRAKGIQIVIDDLGAGFSNLKYIADLQPDLVKLDRELVVNLDKQPRLQRLVKGIVRLCADLGADVVAEGIETEGELWAVFDAGVRYGQGYLLAVPDNPPPRPTMPSALKKRGTPRG